MEPSARTVVRAAWAAGLRPEPELRVSEWADRFRVLPQKSSAEPGPWRTARTPYLAEILDSLSATSPVEQVIFQKAAQVGGSEVLLNLLGYVIDNAPGPTLLVQPTVDLAKRFSRQRIEPLVSSTPRLAGKIAASKSRDKRGSMLSKEFLGGVLVITGANSAVGLRSMPARWLLLDEIDGYPQDIDGEGAPIDLAEARQRTFARKKTVKVSTPTIAGVSAIERAYLASDQRRYYVPCPRCGEMQTLEFARLAWSKLELAPADAVYLCCACDGRIHDHEKTDMLAAGEWRATQAGTDPKTRGYFINGLYSPVGWLSWGKIAETFVRVKHSPDELRVWTNTVLAETWAEKGEAPEWQRLYQRCEGYALGTVPRGGLFVTAGVDVQKDRLVVELVAWGRGKESWSVDYGVLPGDTSDLEAGPWGQLDALLARSFPHEDGIDLPIRMLAVDSGYNTQAVYTWARKYALNRVIAVKGLSTGTGVLIGTPTTVDITMRGRRATYGYKVWPITSGIAKGELYGFLQLEAPLDGQPFPPGWCHFPQYDDTYFRQLTAEQLATRRTRSGFTRLEWELLPGRENHTLDCRVYARAAAALLGLDRYTESDWRVLEGAVSPEGPTAPTPVAKREPWIRRGRA